MEPYLREFIQLLDRLHPGWVYALLLLSAFLENIVPPVPGDTVVVFSAYLVGRGRLGIIPVYLATCGGGILGFMAMYYLGYWQGRAFFARRLSRIFSSENLDKAEKWLARYGGWLLLGNRFLSGVRSVIALSAGIGGMSWKKVAAYGAVSMAVWNGLLLYAGLLVGQHWEKVIYIIEQYNRIFALAVAVLLSLMFVRWRWRCKRA